MLCIVHCALGVYRRIVMALISFILSIPRDFVAYNENCQNEKDSKWMTSLKLLCSIFCVMYQTIAVAICRNYRRPSHYISFGFIQYFFFHPIFVRLFLNFVVWCRSSFAYHLFWFLHLTDLPFQEMSACNGKRLWEAKILPIKSNG